jgi:hypothetical protein
MRRRDCGFQLCNQMSMPSTSEIDVVSRYRPNPNASVRSSQIRTFKTPSRFLLVPDGSELIMAWYLIEECYLY